MVLLLRWWGCSTALGGKGLWLCLVQITGACEALMGRSTGVSSLALQGAQKLVEYGKMLCQSLLSGKVCP